MCRYLPQRRRWCWCPPHSRWTCGDQRRTEPHGGSRFASPIKRDELTLEGQAVLRGGGEGRVEVRYLYDLADTLTITQAVIFCNTKKVDGSPEKIVRITSPSSSCTETSQSAMPSWAVPRGDHACSHHNGRVGARNRRAAGESGDQLRLRPTRVFTASAEGAVEEGRAINRQGGRRGGAAGHRTVLLHACVDEMPMNVADLI